MNDLTEWSKIIAEQAAEDAKKPPQIRTYRYAENGNGWYIAFMDNYGSLSILSDYGNYGYRWGSFGAIEKDGFLRFLTGCDDSYILGKLAQGRSEYQDEPTLAAVKRKIIEYRRDRTLSKEQAREEWDLLREEYENLYTEFDYSRWAMRYGNELFNPEEFAVYEKPQQAQAFVKNVWPRLIAAIKKDLG
jgi:hypothetical protein